MPYNIVHLAYNPRTGEVGHGSAEDVAQQVLHMRLDEHRTIIIKPKGRPERKLHSYNEEWTAEELPRVAARDALKVLSEYGFEHFKREEYVADEQL